MSLKSFLREGVCGVGHYSLFVYNTSAELMDNQPYEEIQVISSFHPYVIESHSARGT